MRIFFLSLPTFTPLSYLQQRETFKGEVLWLLTNVFAVKIWGRGIFWWHQLAICKSFLCKSYFPPTHSSFSPMKVSHYIFQLWQVSKKGVTAGHNCMVTYTVIYHHHVHSVGHLHEPDMLYLLARWSDLPPLSTHEHTPPPSLHPPHHHSR